MDKGNIGTDTGNNILWTKAWHKNWHGHHNFAEQRWLMSNNWLLWDGQEENSEVKTGKVRVLTTDDLLVADVLCSKVTIVL